MLDIPSDISSFDATASPVPDLERLDGGPRFRGGIDWLENGVLSGWAIDLAHPREALQITVAAGGVLLAKALTSIARRDLERYVAQNLAGFRISLRQCGEATLRQIVDRLERATSYELAMPCDLSVELGDTSARIDVGTFGVTQGHFLAELQAQVRTIGEPPELTATALAIPNLEHIDRGPRFRGGIDYLKDATLSGWAIDLTQPHSTLRITLVANDIVLGEAETSMRRSDLALFVPDNIAGFRLDLLQWGAQGPQEVLDKLTAEPPDDFEAPCNLAVYLGDSTSRIDVGRFGVTKGEVLSQLRAAILAKAQQQSLAFEPGSSTEQPAEALLYAKPEDAQIAWLTAASVAEGVTRLPSCDASARGRKSSSHMPPAWRTIRAASSRSCWSRRSALWHSFLSASSLMLTQSATSSMQISTCPPIRKPAPSAETLCCTTS